VACRSDCPVRKYAADVSAGRIPAGKLVRLACARHLRDLNEGPARGLRWDQAAADHALEFFGFLKHSKGRWNAQTFDLSPWQSFIVGSIFGWKRADGTRRYRIVFVEVPRKNGKTTLAAGIGLYLLACDGEAGAEIYCAATKRDQAKIVFADMKAFVRLSPDLSEFIERNAHSLEIPDLRAKVEPLGADSDTVDGLNPSAAICDEIHAWKSRDLWDVLLTGMGAREQPLAVAITTAGDFSESIYNDLRSEAGQILDGVVAGPDTDAFFAYVATPDSEDDWTAPATWRKANPNLGVSLKESELAEVIARAKRRPSEQNKVKRLRLNIRTAALDAWLRLDLWDRCGAPFDPKELAGRECYGGLDLASSQDFAAFVLAFPWGMERGEAVYRVRPYLWLPADADDYHATRLRQKVIGEGWVEAGFVELTPGNAIDHGRIEADILEAVGRYDVRAVAFDPHNGETIAGRVAEAGGVDMLRFPQSATQYNEPARALERAIAGGRLRHNADPVLRWMASNCIAITNGAGHTMPSRKKSRDKIDGIVALTMAVGAHLKQDSDGSSVYDSRGVD
jgi:phage terminase large subunit-like protein